MIIDIKGDITEFDEAQYICHQCNCLTHTAGGLAYSIFNKFPWSNIYLGREKYNFDHKNLPEELQAGNIIVSGNGDNERYVINMLAQVYPGFPKYPRSKLDGYDARLKYFKACIAQIARIDNIKNIAFPYKIGCGMAGGDWKDYLHIITLLDNAWNKKKDIYIVEKK